MSDALSILQVSPSDAGGGAQRSAFNLFKEYQRRGLDSWLAVGKKDSTDPNVIEIPNAMKRSRWSHFLRERAGKAHGEGVAARLARKFAWWFAEPRRFLKTYLGVEDFDYPGTSELLSLTGRAPTLLHCHNLHGDYFDLRELKRFSKIVPVVLSLHDAWLLSGHCSHSFECRRWETGCGQCPDLTIYPSVRRDATHYNWKRKRSIYSHSRLYITTPCRWLMDKVEKSSLMTGAIENRVVPNGIDLATFKPGDKKAAREQLGLPLDAKIIVSVDAWLRTNQFRDYDTLLAAFKLVAAQYKRRVLLLGVGGQAEKGFFNGGEIRVVPFEKDSAKVADFYRAGDVYVHATKADTSPTVILEAMACGLPVVASNVGGIPELIKDGVNGFVVGAGNAADLAEKIGELLQNDTLLTKMSVAAHQYAKANFDLNLQVDRLLSWYGEIIKNWSTGRHAAN